MKQVLTKNFTLLLLGQLFSLFGNYILKFSLAMYILDITGSATIYGSIMALATIPTILLTPFGGVLADRANKKNVMVLLDLSSGFLILITLLFWKSNSISIIAFTLIALSILAAFESPAVESCVPLMLSGDNITLGNALINQISAVSTLITPILGSAFYTIFGIKFILIATIICFFFTAFFEFFIYLPYFKPEKNTNLISTIKDDFRNSIIFIVKTKPRVFAMLIIVTIITFFMQGLMLIGLPFLVRSILNLSTNYYGLMESSLGLAVLIGSILSGLLIKKLKTDKLYILLFLIGSLIVLSGLPFLTNLDSHMIFVLIIIIYFILQILSCIFSIFILSSIQKVTPSDMLGKIMSYVSVITLASQPFGQLIYGVLFDFASSCIYFILLPTGAIICIISVIVRDKLKNDDDL